MEFKEFQTWIPSEVDFRPALPAVVNLFIQSNRKAHASPYGPEGFVITEAERAVGFRKPPQRRAERSRNRPADETVGIDYQRRARDWAHTDPSRRGDKTRASAILYWFYRYVDDPVYFKQLARSIWPHSSETFKRFIYAKCAGELKDDYETINLRFWSDLDTVNTGFHKCWLEEKALFKLDLPTRSEQIYHYTSGVIDILGREAEQEALKRFRDAGPGFRWWQIAGVAGQGKSRLALDLVLKTRKGLPNWRAGFLNDDALHEFGKCCSHWTPNQPHLVVVDYLLARTESLKTVMQTLKARSKDFDVAVCILLIERQAWNFGGIDSFSNKRAEWFSRISGNPSGEDVRLLECLFRNNQNDEDRDLLLLKSPGKKELIEIVKGVAAVRSAVLSETDAEISRILDRLDKDGRPIYAYFLGRALAEGRIDVTHGAADLLDWILDTDFRWRWQSVFDVPAPQCGDDPAKSPRAEGRNPSMRIALLATVVGEIDCREFPVEEGWDRHNSVIRKQALTICDRPLPIGPTPVVVGGLEPDLLGAWFVLRSISFGADASWLAHRAWASSPRNMAQFLVRISQDFPSIQATSLFIKAASHPEESEGIAAFAESVLDISISFSLAELLVPPDVVDFLSSLARNENGKAITDLGIMYSTGAGVTQDCEQGTNWFKIGAEMGETLCMPNLALVLERGSGCERDPEAATEWLRKATKAGNFRAMAMLGISHIRGSTEDSNPRLGMRLLERSAKKGLGIAMANIGTCYLNGHVVKRDPQKAVEWYTRGADAGDGWAMANLAICYFNGTVVGRDPSEAIMWLRRGVATGDGMSMAWLGWAYKEGVGVNRDIQQAISWYQKGIRAGNPGAMALYADCLANGEGVDRDDSGAAQLYRDATVGGYYAARADYAAMIALSGSESASFGKPATTSLPKIDLGARAYFPPLFRAGWRQVNESETTSLREEIERYIALMNLDFSFRDISLSATRITELPFYQSVRVVDLEMFDALGECRAISVLELKFGIILFDGREKTLQMINDRAQFDNDLKYRNEYLHFYISYVFGHKKKSLVVERDKDLVFMGMEMSSYTMSRLSALLRPIDCRIWRGGICRHTVYELSNLRLSECEYETRPNGDVRLLDRKIVFTWEHNGRLPIRTVFE